MKGSKRIAQGARHRLMPLGKARRLWEGLEVEIRLEAHVGPEPYAAWTRPVSQMWRL